MEEVANESLRSVVAGESMLVSIRFESKSSKILVAGFDSRSAEW